jgi:putative heme iron utilization protein
MRDMAKKTPAEQENQAAHRFVTEIAPRIDAFQQRWDGPDHTAEPGSSFAGDDAHSKLYPASHAAWLSIGHAIDDLYALRTLTVHGEGHEFNVSRGPINSPGQRSGTSPARSWSAVTTGSPSS